MFLADARHHKNKKNIWLEQNPNGRLGSSSKPYSCYNITLERLQRRGYEAMLTVYQKIAPSRCIGKPLYTRPVRTVV